MNSKAAVKMSIQGVVGVVLGVFVLLLVLYVGFQLWGVFFPDLSLEVENSFEGLGITVEGINVDEESTAVLYMEKGQQLVAFDRNSSSDYYERPTSCFQKACLVICNKDDNCKDSSYVHVFSFSNFDVTNEDSGIVTLVSGEYVDLKVKGLSDGVSILERDS